jgi:hypothetical protein
LTAFEASLKESQDGDEDDEEEVLTLTTEMIDVGLTDVSKTISPHRALEIQKLRMRRAIRKPKDMTLAAVMKMNKSLSKFPRAADDSKFSTNDLLEILEWSLPAKWRANHCVLGAMWRSDTGSGKRLQLLPLPLPLQLLF